MTNQVNNSDTDLETVTKHVDRFLEDTIEARELSEKCRDYFDHKQWTAEQRQILKRRKQAPIVVNRVRPKVKGLIGLYQLRDSDPKAYPRTKKHEKSSHAITDALRFVADNSTFSDTKADVAEDFFVEGYGGVIVDVKERGKSGEVEILPIRIPWDRIYFDPHSRQKDFKDATYTGFYMWLYDWQVTEMFPDANPDQLLGRGEYKDETTEDRPRWIDQERNRVRIAFHFYQDRGVWKIAVFSFNTFLLKPQISPYLDDDGDPTNPMELVSANIDRENKRYGEVAGFLSQQDEINHRRSKGLFIFSSRQTFGRRGAEDDIQKLKRELAKPDGHVEFDGDEFGKDFGTIPNNDMGRAQIELYQDAKAELDATSFNAQLAGERQSGDLSGVAIDKLQSAGTLELNQDYALLAGWEKRVYRQIWGRVRQHWTEEKWIRVTDDQDSLRWVGLNSQVTAQQWLEEQINDESLDFQTRRKASASFQFLMSAANNPDPQIAQVAQQELQKPVDVANPVAELDVDIILDQSFDVINIQQDQFNKLIQFAQGSDVDVIDLIEMSDLRGKEDLIEKIQKRRQAANDAAGNVAQIEAKKTESEVMVNATKADKMQSEANQKKVETQLLINNPDQSPQAVV